MKTYDEMAKSALKRIDEHHHIIKKRNKVMKCIAIPVVGFLLVEIGFHQMDLSQNFQKISIEDGNPNAMEIKVNPIVSSKAASKRYFDPQYHDVENWNLNQVNAYFGVDFSRLSISNMNFVNRDHFQITRNKNHEIVEDWLYFTYQKDEQKLSIGVSKISCPYDTLYEYETTHPTIFQTRTGEKEIVIGGLEKDNLLIADFEDEDIYFRVQGKNMDVNDFKSSVTMILNQKRK